MVIKIIISNNQINFIYYDAIHYQEKILNVINL